MTVWFTSDLHLGHRYVAETRGFADASDHDLALWQNFSAVLTKHDDLWVLGDLAVSNPEAAFGIIRSLPCRTHLITGNHDKAHPMHRDSHTWQRRYLEVFASVQPFARKRIDGREVLLSHFPYERDRGEPRHTQWRLINRGAWLLHGHTHGTERVTYTPGAVGYDGAELTPPTREIHVGVDAWGMSPVSANTVSELISQQGVMFNVEQPG